MPLYEYACRRCDRRFEALLFGAEKPSCPSCGGVRLDRLLSTFAVGAASGGAAASGPGGMAGADAMTGPAGACGSCGDPRGPGSCGIA